jgi:uncharacterized RDD family membrane protein YckC
MSDDIEALLDKEELTLASIKKRALAYFIDELLLAIIIYAALSGRFNTDNIESFIVAMNKAFLFIITIKILYHGIFTAIYGATLGKIAMRIRVVTIGLLDNPNYLESFLRATMRVAGESLFYLGLIWAMFDPDRQGWHDKAAKTLVIDAV